MSQFVAVLRRPRVGLLALILGVAAAVVLLLPPRPAAALICGPDSYLSHNTVYYSGPKHEKEVGECFGCDGSCTGMQTAYFISLPVCCPGD
jgi:hypothetical protein